MAKNATGAPNQGGQPLETPEQKAAREAAEAQAIAGQGGQPPETPEQKAAREEAEALAAAAAAEGNKEAFLLVTLRHKTPHELYRRTGLVLKREPVDFRVTAGQLDILEADPWVEVVKK